MALSPSSPDTFVREVDDAVRADQLQSFAARFGRPLALAIVVGVLGFGGWLWWQSSQASAAGTAGRDFIAALDTAGQGRPKAAAAAVEPLTKGTSPTYRALALMVQGNSALSEGNIAVAAARFGAVANDAAVDQNLRDVALIRQTLAQYDTLAPEAVVARLRALVARPGPAFASAAELTALAELKRGNDRVAGALFKRIAEAPGVSDSLKSRAVQMAGMLGFDATAPAAATAAAARTGTPAATNATTTPNATATPAAAPRGAATTTGE